MEERNERVTLEESLATRRTIAKGVAGGGLSALFAAVGAGRAGAQVTDDTTGTDDTPGTDDTNADDTTGDSDDTTGDDAASGVVGGVSSKRKSKRRGKRRRK